MTEHPWERVARAMVDLTISLINLSEGCKSLIGIEEYDKRYLSFQIALEKADECWHSMHHDELPITGYLKFENLLSTDIGRWEGISVCDTTFTIAESICLHFPEEPAIEEFDSVRRECAQLTDLFHELHHRIRAEVHLHLRSLRGGNSAPRSEENLLNPIEIPVTEYEVTIRQIAVRVHKSPKTVQEWANSEGWRKTRIGSGRDPARYDWREIRPLVMKRPDVAILELP